MSKIDEIKAKLAAARTASLVKQVEEKAPTVEKMDDVSVLRKRIYAIASIEENEDLRHAMDDLRLALLANPAACNLLLPEDVGQLVGYIRKTNFAWLQANVKPAKAKAAAAPSSKSKAKISEDEMADFFSSLDSL
jgi:hypothetical protein